MYDAKKPEDEPSPGAIFLEFLRLGLTSFGGPVAHLGYFREAFVRRLGWMEEGAYADLVALCQFLPGPTSSQVGMGVGYEKAGLPGAIAAFVAFTLPSALVMAGLGLGLASGIGIDAGLVGGLALVAVAVVAEAVRGMAGSLATTRFTSGLAVAAAAAALLLPFALTQIGIIAAAALIGLALAPDRPPTVPAGVAAPGSRRLGIAALVLFALLLAALPMLASQSSIAALAAPFYQAGALVFGGGHVVLPLLERGVVGTGMIAPESFIAGYGAAQAMPGPLFSLAAFLGATAAMPGPWSGALIATLALFAPGFLLVIGVLPFWRRLAGFGPARRALTGVNAAVVGILAAALYDPVFTTAVHAPHDLALAIVAWGLLAVARWPAWLVVILGAAAGFAHPFA
ncbi:chromate efflux transporter [Kaistia geumhonensis]|uniref:Chromate transporter n=1 Tax=Kaistia geumhonensis TaxID=410839 RepID=A0ABU0M8Y1_9HYPH|nr:chromate efflux transporter [Kaistia geumhonensis]MCX5480861.1 chromate efflux transporter [Kaistia geumhonensis]MDQ0517435.1 chromate transporter [Kaistia geumhonensis]